MSTDLRRLLSCASKEFLEYTDSVKEVNHQIRHLIDMISSPLGQLLEQLHNAVAQLDSPCSDVLNTSWNSHYMCQGIAFNRKTEVHRDSSGFPNTLEALYLLGDFEPGHLTFQDLNMSVEWGPRNLCLFDGYTFAHGASDCGKGRVCCISFNRASTFNGLHVPIFVPPPKAANIKSTLRRY